MTAALLPENSLLGQPRRLIVEHLMNGWEVREEKDGAIVSTKRYDDWHRVERFVQVFDLAMTTGPKDH